MLTLSAPSFNFLLYCIMIIFVYARRKRGDKGKHLVNLGLAGTAQK